MIPAAAEAKLTPWIMSWILPLCPRNGGTKGSPRRSAVSMCRACARKQLRIKNKEPRKKCIANWRKERCFPPYWFILIKGAYDENTHKFWQFNMLLIWSVKGRFSHVAEFQCGISSNRCWALENLWHLLSTSRFGGQVGRSSRRWGGRRRARSDRACLRRRSGRRTRELN